MPKKNNNSLSVVYHFNLSEYCLKIRQYRLIFRQPGDYSISPLNCSNSLYYPWRDCPSRKKTLSLHPVF
ncbi:hypothetical protein BOVA604_1434 [Bacteroides ovatus]|nr:hypothetical protein BOVA604_1434 [Bacteroides ovatus]